MNTHLLSGFNKVKTELRDGAIEIGAVLFFSRYLVLSLLAFFGFAAMLAHIAEQGPWTTYWGSSVTRGMLVCKSEKVSGGLVVVRGSQYDSGGAHYSFTAVAQPFPTPRREALRYKTLALESTVSFHGGSHENKSAGEINLGVCLSTVPSLFWSDYF